MDWNIYKIERLITEEPDVVGGATGSYDICPKCGGLFAAVADTEIACINKDCQNYDPEYDKTLELLNGITPSFLEQTGTLRSSRSTVIPFIAIKDMGRYYVVYIPSPHVTFSRRHSKNPRGRDVKHTELATVEKVFPVFNVHVPGNYPGKFELNDAIEALRLAERRMIEVDAPMVLINRCRERIAELSGRPPYKGAFGGLKYTHRAKIITINRRNVEKITKQ